ncbi:MAG: hypothetical protein J0H27_01575 [Xanthomonadales bacterium]|nr:hypothetical protein [Xanthomonadales bacterium]ODU94830.1 MAG: hypothetical protein ABT18_02415 [Rhodanobacter sp. SCN 66-43]OJY82817.1 MAG: hypothetical protein BGP23_06875 [Xanthomonadales bacterium 66-474]
MKRILLVFLIGVALLLAVGGLFYTHVGIRHVLSHNASDWASFGEYFGGVAGTLLAFISILLLVYTVYIQNEQLSNAQHQMLKRDLLAHVTKADDEIGHWLGRQIALPSLSGATVEFGDVVWGLLEPKQVDPKEFQRAVVRLHVLTCLYCEALALYRDNIDPYFIFKYHRQKAESLLKFLTTHQVLLGPMAGPSLKFCQMGLDGQHES